MCWRSLPAVTDFVNAFFSSLDAAHKEGFLGDKVNGKILFRLKMNEPYFYHEDVLAYDVKATAKKSFFGNKVEYDNPAGMNEFMNYFLNAWKAGLDAKTAQLQAQADALLNQNQY